MSEVVLPPGWLIRDMRRASARLDQWRATGGYEQKERTMTPDVPRLREMLDEPQTGLTLAPGPLAMWIGALHQRQNRMIRALLSSAPPDGAAEREANDLECGRCDGDGFEPSTHSRNACSLCGGSGRLPTPAPTEAPAADKVQLTWKDFDAADVAFRNWTPPKTDGEPSQWAVYNAGWIASRQHYAALAARPAAVTDAMADQIAERVTSGLPFNNYDVVTTTKRDLEQRVLAAALAARGPA